MFRRFRQPSRRKPTRRPRVEALETRLTPAFTLTISNAATVNVLHDNAGHFTATHTGANVSVADIRKDLLAGKSVTISDGTAGSEDGNISWAIGNDLDYTGAGSGLGLTIAVDRSATVGNVTIDSSISAPGTTGTDALAVRVSARGDLQLRGDVLAGAAPVSLAADVLPDGSGDDGAGALALLDRSIVSASGGSATDVGATVSGSAVTLRGATLNLLTGRDSATVAADSAAQLAGPSGEANLGPVTIRSSLPSLPLGIGSPDLSGTPHVLLVTNAELLRVHASSLTFGDAGQTGDITFGSAVLASAVTALQSPKGPGKIVLNAGTGLALRDPLGATLSAGTGGIQQIETFGTGVGAGTGAPVAVQTNVVSLSTAGTVGSLVHPLTLDATSLGAGRVGGSAFLAAVGDLTTGGTLTVSRSLFLTLPGNFSTRPGDLHALQTNLFFTAVGSQDLDSGGQTLLGSVVHKGTGTLRLVNHALFVTGSLTNPTGAGDFDANDQTVAVGGLTTINDGVYSAGSGPQAFLGGLVVNGGFDGGTGPVSAGAVMLGAGAVLVAPSGSLSISGDFTNAGGIFDANGGTVLFDGSGKQRLTSGGAVFNNLAHAGLGVLTVADDLTVAGSFTNVDGAGRVDITGRTVQVGGDWSWGKTGSLLSKGSTVVLIGTDQHVSGSSTFFNLTKVVTAADTLTFQAGSTQTVLGTLTLQGAADNRLALRSSTDGTPWKINPRGPRSVSFVDVKDSSDLGAKLTAASSNNSGGNTNWAFPVAATR
jgi:hypothetical protein